MTDTTPDTSTVTVERIFPAPVDRVWRALTTPHLMAEWLMQTDFAPNVGQAFTLTGDWGSVDCTVKEVEPGRRLSYTWNAMGLESVVTFSLTPTDAGTRLRMDQIGFRPDQQQAWHGARFGWGKMFDALDALLARPGAEVRP